MKQYLLSLTIICCCYFTQAQQIIQLTDYAGHPKLKAVNVEIDGMPFNFLFDTGAGVTLLTPEALKKLGRKSFGNAVGYRMKGEKVSYQWCDSIQLHLGEYTHFHQQVGVWELNVALPKDWPIIDGVISLATFQDQCITLDLGNNQIVVENQKTCHEKLESGKLLQAVFANGFTGMEKSIFIEEVRNGHTYRFLMDSGNLDKVKLSYATCNDWNISTDSTSGRQDVGEINYSLSNKTNQLPTVVDDIIYDGVYNFDLIANHIITISTKEQRVSIKQ